MGPDWVELRHRIDSLCRIGEQPSLEFRIGPGARNDARPDMRADPGLDVLDDLIECGRIDVALLGQDRFERPHPELHLRQLGAVIVGVVICRHIDTSRGRFAQARTARLRDGRILDGLPLPI